MSKTRRNGSLAKKKTQKRKKGGFFGSWFKRKPKTTNEELTEIQKYIEDLKLGKVEQAMSKEIENAKQLRNKCINDCKTSGCSTNDTGICTQLNKMISEKSDYEWGTLCGNSLNVTTCKNYLNSYKKLELYTKYVKSVSNKCEMMMNEYKNSLSPDLMNSDFLSTNNKNNTNNAHFENSNPMSSETIRMN